jgi:hypothetical protein
LLNVDADNVLSPVYLENMCNGVFGRSPNVLNATVPGNPHPPSTTGRIGMFAKLFNTLRGYDEQDTAPSGYQDVDMSTRIWRYQQKNGGELTTLKTWNVLVGALSNDTSAVTDRGLAKIGNCSPEARAVWPTWSQMNDHNLRLMRKRTQAQQLTRNTGARIGGWWAEAEDWVGWLSLLREGTMASLGAPAKAAPAVARQRTRTAAANTWDRCFSSPRGQGNCGRGCALHWCHWRHASGRAYGAARRRGCAHDAGGAACDSAACCASGCLRNAVYLDLWLPAPLRGGALHPDVPCVFKLERV